MKSTLMAAALGLLAAAAGASSPDDAQATRAGDGRAAQAPRDAAPGTPATAACTGGKHADRRANRSDGRDHRHEDERAAHERRRDRSGPDMRVVPTSASAGEAGHGWRYFVDPAARRAVVVSPQGDYYYSRGKGLRPVATPSES